MREILFRGKRKTNNTWAYGGYIKDIAENEIHIGDTRLFSTIYPETFGQYTGLKDKNGTKIFEGDIVNMLNITDYPMQIKWSKKWARFIFYNLVDKTEMNLFTEQCEVIGNIYDNSELVKE